MNLVPSQHYIPDRLEIKAFLDAPRSTLRVGYRRLRQSLDEHFRCRLSSENRAAVERLVEVAELYGSDLLVQGYAPTLPTVLAYYLNRRGEFAEFGLGEFGDSRPLPAVPVMSMQVHNRKLYDEAGEEHTPFGYWVKKEIFQALDLVLSDPRKAPESLQILFSHNQFNTNGERRLVQHSRVDLCVAIIKQLLQELDWPSMTFTKFYIDTKNENRDMRGLRRGTRQWLEIAQALNCTFINQQGDEEPSSRFYKAVSWLKSKGILASHKIALKKRCGDVIALPSLKHISTDWIYAMGISEKRLKDMRDTASKSQVTSFKRYLEGLVQSSEQQGFKHSVVHWLKARAKTIKAALSRGEKLHVGVHSILDIPIIYEFKAPPQAT